MLQLFRSSFILVFHAVVVSIVRRYLLLDNVLEANMKFSFYLFTLRGEYKFHQIEEEKTYSDVLLVVFHAIVNGRWFVFRILISCLFRRK